MSSQALPKNGFWCHIETLAVLKIFLGGVARLIQGAITWIFLISNKFSGHSGSN